MRKSSEYKLLQELLRNNNPNDLLKQNSRKNEAVGDFMYSLIFSVAKNSKAFNE